jgi:hypothetical protein
MGDPMIKVDQMNYLHHGPFRLWNGPFQADVNNGMVRWIPANDYDGYDEDKDENRYDEGGKWVIRANTPDGGAWDIVIWDGHSGNFR